VAAFATVAAASSAGAQAPAEPSAADLERARAQFGQAVALAEDGRWEEAVDLFRQVLAVRRAPPVVYNLAHALFELGEFAEADPLLQEVLGDPSTTASIREGAQQLRAQMERTGGRLTVSVAGDLEGAVVLLDFRPLPPESLGRPLLVRAGRHVVTAEREGATVARSEGSVVEGGQAGISLTVASSAERAAEVAATPPTPEEAAARAATEGAGEEAVPLRKRWQLWVGVGAGVVAVALAIGIGVAVAGGDQPNTPYSGNLNPPILVFP